MASSKSIHCSVKRLGGEKKKRNQELSSGRNFVWYFNEHLSVIAALTFTVHGIVYVKTASNCQSHSPVNNNLEYSFRGRKSRKTIEEK